MFYASVRKPVLCNGRECTINIFYKKLKRSYFLIRGKFAKFEGQTNHLTRLNTVAMEQTLIILKPSAIQRSLVGDVLTRFQRKGLIIAGIKMMQLDEAILREHYAHLVDRPFFPTLLASMMATPVIVMVLKGNDVVTVVRSMVGATNSRKADPGTIRGDFGMSGQENIVHASDSPENAEIEIRRFFKPEEVFDYEPITFRSIYAPDER